MAKGVTHYMKRKGRLPALVTSLFILALAVVQATIKALSNFVLYGVYGLTSGDGVSGVTSDEFLGLASATVFSLLPFAIGVFLSLWIIAPITDELTLRFVIARAVLASAAGAVVVFVVGLIGAIVNVFRFTGPIFGNSFPTIDTGRITVAILSAVNGAVSQFVDGVPIVVLAGILLWMWLREHPLKHAVYGLIDEV